MNYIKKVFSCLFSLFIASLMLYADLILSFPEEITMHLLENHKSRLGAGVSMGNFPENICVLSGADTVTPISTGSFDITLNIGSIPFKKARLNVTEQKSLYASGELVGLRIYNRGLIVTDLAPVMCGGKEISPAQDAGVLPGDVIIEINGNIPKESDDVASLISPETILTLKRNNSIKKVTLSPAFDDNDRKYKLGIWVRDSSAGVGTVTYINSDLLTYGALGHGISDSDTGLIFDVASGTFEKSRVISVEKGKKGVPGQICGSFSPSGEPSGTVTQNCEVGIFGDIFPHSDISGKLYPIGVMSQVETGDALILSTVDEKIREYKIRILRTMPFGTATKGLAIEITDPSLLEKTGGIVQGMSGSPIIQNGKLIGAVTHVLVNDPTRGYGIFIENMLSEAEKIK